MAIGTKVKVGFDGSAVKRGLAGLRAGFGRMGRMMGRGLRAGAVAGSLGAVTAIGAAIKAAMGIKDLADYGSGLSDMAMQTGLAVKELVLLEEALRLAGVPAKDTSRVLSTLAGNTQEAMKQTGLARDAFNDLGIYMNEVRGMNVHEVFDLIGKKIRSSGGEIQNLEMAMEGLFGARIGYGLLRLFKDPANFDKARKNVAGLAEDLNASANDLDRLADDLGGLRVQMRGFYLGLYRAAQGAFGENPLQGMFDMFNYENAKPFFDKLRETFVWLREGPGLGEMLENSIIQLREAVYGLGQEFGEGVKDSLSGALGGGIGGLLNPFNGFSKETGATDKLGAKVDRTNSILQRMQRDGGAVWA
jgi:hypothetical protein